MSDVILLAELIHHRELLVKPLFWTSRHLEVMGCRFQHVYDAPLMEHTRDDQRPSETPSEGESEARSLARNFSHQGKLNALTNILLSKRSIFDERRKGPHFIFGGQSIHRPQYTVFYRCNKPDRSVCQDPLPRVGYLNYTNVSGTSRHKFQPRHSRGGDDSAISRLSKKKLARVTLKEWTEDPYFVCVLLSLAQLQERWLKSPRPTSHLVTAPYLFEILIDFTFRFPNSHIQVPSSCSKPYRPRIYSFYEIQIASDFLGMLHNPAAATIQTSFPTIERRQIPSRPFETFQERILAELSVENIPPHVSNKRDNTNRKSKRTHEKEEDESRKRGRAS